MKQIWKIIVIIPITIGIILAGVITFKNQANKIDEEEKIQTVFGSVAGKPAEVIKFYTYGESLNVEGKISGILKDNFEGIKLVVTDGGKYSKSYDVDFSFDNGSLNFSSSKINKTIILDDLNPRKILCSN